MSFELFHGICAEHTNTGAAESTQFSAAQHSSKVQQYSINMSSCVMMMSCLWIVRNKVSPSISGCPSSSQNTLQSIRRAAVVLLSGKTTKIPSGEESADQASPLHPTTVVNLAGYHSLSRSRRTTHQTLRNRSPYALGSICWTKSRFPTAEFSSSPAP